MFSFDHIAISVTNLERSIEFYQKLGFILDNQFEDGDYKWATLKLNEFSLEIFCYNKNNNKFSGDLSITGVNHFALNTKNIDDCIQNIKEFYSGKIEIYYGDLNRKSFWIKDPDNIGIQIIETKKLVKKKRWITLVLAI